MRVKIEEIQSQGLNLEEKLDGEVLREALSEAGGYALVSATPLKVAFRKVSGQVHLSGGFEATVSAPCKRCLKELTLAVPVDFTLRMVPQTARRPVADEVVVPGAAGKGGSRRKGRAREDDPRLEAAASFELDEVDAEAFDGKTIDLDPILREQVLLAMPVAVVCREDCKGLCTVCGQDLNERDCGHGGERAVDARLAKLKDIKLKN
jgi:uncharacterized protein